MAQEEIDGRDLVGDNQDNVEFYVGVDPIYQNYANEGEKPYPFHQEEIELRARQGGIPEGEQSGYSAMLLDAPGVGEEENEGKDALPPALKMTSNPSVSTAPAVPKS